MQEKLAIKTKGMNKSKKKSPHFGFSDLTRLTCRKILSQTSQYSDSLMNIYGPTKLSWEGWPLFE